MSVAGDDGHYPMSAPDLAATAPHDWCPARIINDREDSHLRKGPPPPLTLNKQIINPDFWELPEDTLFFFIISGLSRQ